MAAGQGALSRLLEEGKKTFCILVRLLERGPNFSPSRDAAVDPGAVQTPTETSCTHWMDPISVFLMITCKM